MTRFYAHQAEAIDGARRGHHLIVTTATASGKSLCYNAPVLETLLLDRAARALYLFPTKALAQDQRGKIEALGLFPDVITATYDGDTPREERGRSSGRRGWSSPTRTCSTWASCPTTPAGGRFCATCATSSWTRRTSTAASSARTSAQHSAETSPRRRALQRPAAVHRLLGHHRQPRRAFLRDRSGRRGRQQRRRADRQKALRLLEPARVRPRQRRSAARRTPRRRRSSRPWWARGCAPSPLRAPQDGGACCSPTPAPPSSGPRVPSLAQRVLSYRAGYTPAQRRDIERRLFSGEPDRRHGNQRPRTGRRHRRRGRLRADGLPRHGRLDVAAAARAGRRQGDALWPCWSPRTTRSTSS